MAAIDITDLPDELIAQLSARNNPASPMRKIYEWASIQTQSFTVDQLLIGVFHTNNVVLKRGTVSGYLSKMKNEGLIKSAGRGVFQNVQDGS